MSVAELLSDLARRGIQLEAHGDQLRWYPRDAFPADFVDWLRANKRDVIDWLSADSPADPPSTANASHNPSAKADNWPAFEALGRCPVDVTPCEPTNEVCRCGSTAWRDVPIHEGRSVRRDCAKCGRFIDFPVWYEKNRIDNHNA
jgi:hypothetical protein